MVTQISSSTGQMAVLLHSTSQAPLPAQVVVCTSQNLHSLFILKFGPGVKDKKKVRRADSGTENKAGTKLLSSKLLD